MARAIFIFTLAALIAGFVVFVVSFPGWVTVDWFGYRYEAPMSVTTLILLGLLTAFYFLMRIIRTVAGGPAAWQRYFRRRRTERGMGALTQGLAAAAAGDAHAAHRQAARAERLVKDGPLAQVLALEAAVLEERDADVAALAPILLHHGETALLGHRALFDLARKAGDAAAEVAQAEAAFAAHPAAGWAAEALLADAIDAADWDRARSVLTRAARHDAFPNGRPARLKAALQLAEAHAARGESDTARAATLARKAWDADSALVAAAVLRADLLAETGKPKAAREIAPRIWADHPHPVPGRLFAAADGDEPQEARHARLRDLLTKNPRHVESRLLAAEVAIEEREIASAREALMPLVTGAGSARAFALMASLEQAEHGAAAQPEEWIGRALAAPRDAVWVCGACGHRDARWNAVCPHCRSVGTAAWATHDKVRRETGSVKDAAAPAIVTSAHAEPTSSPASVTGGHAAQSESVATETDTDAAPRQPDDPGPDKSKPEAEGREW